MGMMKLCGCGEGVCDCVRGVWPLRYWRRWHVGVVEGWRRFMGWACGCGLGVWPLRYWRRWRCGRPLLVKGRGRDTESTKSSSASFLRNTTRCVYVYVCMSVCMYECVLVNQEISLNQCYPYNSDTSHLHDQDIPMIRTHHNQDTPYQDRMPTVNSL